MGSKNLKAVIVKSVRRTPIADRDALSLLLKEKLEGLKGNTRAYTTYGTTFLVNAINEGLAAMVNSLTGWNISSEELEKIGERIYNLERMINVGRGAGRKDDTLPYRVRHEPIPDGPVSGRYCPEEELKRMLDEYYALRGWAWDGVPTEEKLAELGLK